MNTHELVDELDRLAGKVPVGPPPVTQMVQQAGRRRRTYGVLAVAATAVLGVVLTLGVLHPPRRSPEPTTEPVPPPAGTRWMGHGHAAIAVPAQWGVNKLYCHAPTENTVLVEVDSFLDCGAPFPEGVTAVWISGYPDERPLGAEHQVTIDGVDAVRTEVRCAPGAFAIGPVCSGSLEIPSEDARFVVESTAGKRDVDDLLDSVRVLPAQLSVPISRTEGRGDGQGLSSYRDELEALGFKVSVREVRDPDARVGHVVDVRPAPGTVAEVGSTVRLTVAIPRFEPETPPAGTRFVGIGRAAVVVPTGWAVNDTDCAVPSSDTVIIDLGAVGDCRATRPPNVESVALFVRKSQPEWADPAERIEIGGVRAFRSETTCRPGFCEARVWLPSQAAGFVVASSTDAGTVDDLLDTIHVVKGSVAVPPIRWSDGSLKGKELYADQLDLLGLDYREKSDNQPGTYLRVLETDPPAGTVVPLGSEVEVLVGAF